MGDQLSLTGRDRRLTVALALVLALSALVYTYHLPFEWTTSSPLSWDQAGQYFQAIRFANGVQDADGRALRAALQGANLYPPGQSVVLGTWFMAFGQGMAAWLTFGLVVFVATVALLYRGGAVAAVAFVVSPILCGLAPSLMVEPVVCLWLVAAFLAFPQPGPEPVPVWRFALFALVATATLLTKYNVGLPLLPAAALAALVSRNRRIIIGTVVVVLVAGGSWAGFLSWQDEGWTNFLRFAENRSNSAGQLPIDRVLWYVGSYTKSFVGQRGLAIVLGLLALVGGAWSLARKRPWSQAIPNVRLVFALAYVAVSMIALARHEYLLTRNLVGPTIALYFAAGLVVGEMATLRRRIATGLVVLLAAGSLFLNAESTRSSWVERYYPARNSILRDLSEALVERVDPADQTRVVGVFNEFSAGWVRVLQTREMPGASIETDAPYPLERDRDALSDQWSDAYAEIVEAWHRDGIDRIIGIVVHDDGTFDSTEYRAWNRWKRNLVRAADESPGFALEDSLELRGGVMLKVYTAVQDEEVQE